MLTTVKTYRDIVDANLDKGFLEANGIECYLKNEEMVAANLLYSQAVGGVELQVELQNGKNALDLLNSK